jgi:hypothetical protein
MVTVREAIWHGPGAVLLEAFRGIAVARLLIATNKQYRDIFWGINMSWRGLPAARSTSLI